MCARCVHKRVVRSVLKQVMSSVVFLVKVKLKFWQCSGLSENWMVVKYREDVPNACRGFIFVYQVANYIYSRNASRYIIGYFLLLFFYVLTEYQNDLLTIISYL